MGLVAHLFTSCSENRPNKALTQGGKGVPSHALPTASEDV
jgi:hypothetical protein